MHKWYSLALRLAETSNHPKHKLAAVVVKGGAVLSQATNLRERYKHAECRAIRAAGHGRVGGATIVVARVKAAMSKPCEACMQAIKEAGITRIVYADWFNNITVENC